MKGFNLELLQWFVNFLVKIWVLHTKKTEINSGVVSENQKLGEELHKPIIGKFKK